MRLFGRFSGPLGFHRVLLYPVLRKESFLGPSLDHGGVAVIDQDGRVVLTISVCSIGARGMSRYAGRALLDLGVFDSWNGLEGV